MLWLRKCHFAFLATLFTAVMALHSAAHASKRIALIIGNSAYRHSGELENPVHDAALLSVALRQANFTVISRTNLDLKAMKAAFRQYTNALREAGPDGVGLFYYSGHGTQVNGQNYLLPVDANIEREDQVDSDAVSAVSLMAQLEAAGNRMNIVVLDSCRNNPFKRGYRAQVRGLARMDAPSSSLIAYSTEPGNVALDGNNGYSPYAIALQRAMRQPGIAIEQAFKRVRNEVRAATEGKQIPWEESSLFGDFYFIPKGTKTSPNGDPITAAPAMDTAAFNTEAKLWRDIRSSRDQSAFEKYLEKYSGGTFALVARDRLALLKEKAATTAIAAKPATDATKAYFVDEFDGDQLGAHWDVLNPDEESYIVEDGYLTVLLTNITKPTMENIPNIFRLLKDMPKGDWTMTTKIDFAPQTMSEWMSIGLRKRDGKGVTSNLQIHTTNYGRETRFYLRGDKKTRKDSTFSQEIYRLWVDDSRDITTRTNTFSSSIKSVLLRLEKKGRRYIASGKFVPVNPNDDKVPATKWVALPKLTSLRTPGDKLTLILYTALTDQNQPKGTEGLVNIDWVRIEATSAAKSASGN